MAWIAAVVPRSAVVPVGLGVVERALLGRVVPALAEPSRAGLVSSRRWDGRLESVDAKPVRTSVLSGVSAVGEPVAGFAAVVARSAVGLGEVVPVLVGRAAVVSAGLGVVGRALVGSVLVEAG